MGSRSARNPAARAAGLLPRPLRHGFHGPDPNHLYGGSYSDDDLRWWAERIREWADQGRDVFAYFNNDWEGNAVRNADRLKETTPESGCLVFSGRIVTTATMKPISRKNVAISIGAWIMKWICRFCA